MAGVIAIKEGALITARVMSPFGTFPQNTLISGHFFLIKDSVYGRFTEAILPGGEKVPVCLETAGDHRDDLGSKIIPGGKPGSALITTTFHIIWVNSFRSF